MLKLKTVTHDINGLESSKLKVFTIKVVENGEETTDI
jgi:hypothetical protein